ncbi:MAG: hypothetical protein AB2814_02280 [Candidatus Sedimenticola endophacoides]
MTRTIPFFLLFLLLCGAPEAAAPIRVVALFSGKAMIEVDGRNHLLRVGETGPGGVLLVEANAREAVLEVDGVRETYSLGGASVVVSRSASIGRCGLPRGLRGGITPWAASTGA